MFDIVDISVAAEFSVVVAVVAEDSVVVVVAVVAEVTVVAVIKAKHQGDSFSRHLEQSSSV